MPDELQPPEKQTIIAAQIAIALLSLGKQSDAPILLEFNIPVTLKESVDVERSKLTGWGGQVVEMLTTNATFR